MSPKRLCHACGWTGLAEDLLRAPSPFDGSELVACPNCKDCGDVLRVACDTAVCWRKVMMGLPTTDGGYRNVCRMECL